MAFAYYVSGAVCGSTNFSKKVLRFSNLRKFHELNLSNKFWVPPQVWPDLWVSCPCKYFHSQVCLTRLGVAKLGCALVCFSCSTYVLLWFKLVYKLAGKEDKSLDRHIALLPVAFKKAYRRAVTLGHPCAVAVLCLASTRRPAFKIFSWHLETTLVVTLNVGKSGAAQRRQF